MPGSMSSSFFQHITPKYELGFEWRMWNLDSDYEIEEPSAKFNIHVENRCSLFYSGRTQFSLIMPSDVSVAEDTFRVKISNMLHPRKSEHCLRIMLGVMKIDVAIVDDLTQAVSSFSRSKVEEAISCGFGGLEIGIWVRVQTGGFFDGDAAMLDMYRTESWDPQVVCAICLDELGGCEAEEVSLLPCSHSFHRKCVKGWLQKGDSCPLCRSKL